jgi:hypothetical protein
MIMKEIMKSVNLANKEVLEELNKLKDLWWADREHLSDYCHLNCSDFNREEWISDEYKNKIMGMGSAHDGFPVALKAYDLKVHKDLEKIKQFSVINENLQLLLGTKRNALAAVYPPGGFISWHNNANASAYNLVITWSETGEGYWKHIDPYTGKEVLVKDVPGWQCKAFFFGAYEDKPEDIVYHMASTDCWRMTIGYMFDRDHKQYWEDVIEELGME